MNTTKAVANSGATKNQNNGKAETKTAEVKKALTADTNPELSSYSVAAPPPPIEPGAEKTGAPGETPKPKTMQERLNRFYELERLMERRETLVEHLEKLGGFVLSPTGSSHLKITDDKNQSFGIAHPIVIGEMVHLAKQKLQAELDSVEAQIIL